MKKRHPRSHSIVLLLTNIGFISIKEPDAKELRNGKGESLNRFLTTGDKETKSTPNLAAPTQKNKKHVLTLVML